ncbi:MAG TPA: adenylate/guanylate cyclase domain-containing protein [Actinomycetota bacterium]
MPRPAEDAIAAGREALERHAWQEAYENLSEADRRGSLAAEGLALLAESAWWAARPDDVIEALERAYAAYLKEDDRREAAMMAFRVAEQHGMRMAGPQAQGWASRAAELVADDPDAPVHGWLAWIQGLMTLAMGGDEEESLGHYDRALEIARRLGDRDLEAMSLHDMGHILCSRGQVTEGLALMDQVMVAAVGGELDPTATGYVYCGMIGICSRLGDYGRAAEWTEATMRWCERHSITGFPGVCRVHRAELLRLRGALEQAEEEARLACDELPRFNLYSGLGHAWYEIAEVRRRMGDVAAAEAAFAAAHEHGKSPQPGLSLLRLAQGRVEAAAAGIAQALAEAGDDRLARMRHLPAQAMIALEAGDLETAAAAAEELAEIVEGHGAPAMRATLSSVRGALLLARGDAEAALPHLREARDGWRGLDAPYEIAEVRLLLARACRATGDEDGARMEARAARSAFETLGARPAAEAAAELVGTPTAAERPERVRRAFMFTDIERSTDLVGVIGDEAWESLLGWHDRTLRSLFASHGGEVAHHTGDGFFVSFEDPASALACAVAVQRALAEHRRTHGFAPRVRIGVHTAEATRRGQDYGGVEVHKAARIAAEARGGEILASEETARGGGTTVSGDPRTVSLKGISEPVRVVPVRWRDG